MNTRASETYLAMQTATLAEKATLLANSGRFAQAVQVLEGKNQMPSEEDILRQMQDQFRLENVQPGGDGHGVDAAVAEAAAADERRRVFLEQGLPAGFMDYARLGRQRADALGEGLLPDSAARRIFLEDVRATVQATQLKALGADGLNCPFLSIPIADDDEALERYADLCLLMADGFWPPKAAEALGISILVPRA